MGRNLDTSKFGPNEFVRGREKRWEIGLLKTLKALPVENDMTIRQCEYLELLKTCCPLFQSSFFFVRVLNISVFFHPIFNQFSHSHIPSECAHSLGIRLSQQSSLNITL
jgi:hypothetical protein